MMLSAHSALRDRYRRLSRTLTLAIMTLSLVGLVLALANPDQTVDLIIRARLAYITAALATLILVLAVTDLVVDWRERAWTHGLAASKLGRLKALHVRQTGRDSPVDDAELVREYNNTMAGIVPIPEAQFLRLKSRHLRKVEMSRRLDDRPGARPWMLQIEVFIEGFGWKRHPSRGDDGGDA